MGIYLNSADAYSLYKSESVKPYFVDKTEMLEELFPLARQGNNYICITRPRRFGKTVMANMIASFFNRDKASEDLFGQLKISGNPDYGKYLNQYSVIHITFSDLPRNCRDYEQYIARIENRLIRDLKQEYPSCRIEEDEAVWDALSEIRAMDDTVRFIFVLDEWDFIFHRDFVTEKDKQSYLMFLNNLLKDRAYVSMAYMTGILPIAKYSSGSELNMFVEFTMAGAPAFSEYFGFTEEEVDGLYLRYLGNCPDPAVTREGLRDWYNGYHTASGKRIYNPRSVAYALQYNHLANYWTSSGPYDEISYYIGKNTAEVRDDLAVMISGEAVPAKIQEYAASSMNLRTKDEIFSAMVVYGFLSYSDGKVSIPNKELMDRFLDLLKKESSLGYVYQLAKESERMLTATLCGDTQTMAEILAYAHDTEIPLYHYNSETELAAIVNLVYLSVREDYDIVREDKSGIGYVDFIFYPRKRSGDCIILELKINHSPEEAIEQIKDRKYALRFKGRLGESPQYTGRILAVGIAYDKKTKKHGCKVEIL